MYHYCDKKKITDPGRSENTKQDKYENKLKKQHLETSYSKCNKQTTPLKKKPNSKPNKHKTTPQNTSNPKKSPTNQPTKQNTKDKVKLLKEARGGE